MLDAADSAAREACVAYAETALSADAERLEAGKGSGVRQQREEDGRNGTHPTWPRHFHSTPRTC